MNYRKMSAIKNSVLNYYTFKLAFSFRFGGKQLRPKLTGRRQLSFAGLLARAYFALIHRVLLFGR